MSDILILKAANYMSDGIGFSDISQKLVTESLTLGGAGHKTGDINKFHTGWYHSLGIDDVCQFIQTTVRHGNNTGIGLNSAEREILRTNASFGKCIE